MPLNDNVGQQQQDGGDSAADLNPRATLEVEEMVSEEEARKRREQLNRRPSYRMILKDLETVGDKPMKKEMEENNSPSISNESHQQQQQAVNSSHQQQQATSSLQHQLPDSSTDSQQNFASNGGIQHLVGNMQQQSAAGVKPTGLGTPGGGPSRVSAPNPIAHLPPPAQSHITLGQLNLLAPQGRLLAEIPSQPQPQIPSTAALSAVNNLEMLGLKAPENLSAAFAQNEWQNSLLNSYGRQQLQPPPQQQQQQQIHLLQQNPSNSLAGMNNGGQSGSPLGMGQQHGGPPHGLGTRQGSASLTSLSDNDETSRKRQVRLLKNREAAKECRRKKKEYVKCLENRVAVLENQNKALIEELKTLKELYCRKEKGDMQ